MPPASSLLSRLLPIAYSSNSYVEFCKLSTSFSLTIVSPTQEISSTVGSLEENEIPFPPLPVELVRDVIELAGIADIPTALSLALVSKVFNKWITPILYDTVVLDGRESALAFNRGIEAAQCDERDKVRHISTLAIYGTAMAHYDWTLTLCRDVQRLLLKPGFRAIELIDNNVSLWPRPSHVVLLAIFPSWFAEILDCFTHTTHLYLDQGLYPDMVEICVHLPLTHICIAVWEDEEAWETTRSSAESMLAIPSIKVVLIHAFIAGYPVEDFCGGVWSYLADIDDERLIVASGMTDNDLLELFESGGTVWDMAEEMRDWRHHVGGVS